MSEDTKKVLNLYEKLNEARLEIRKANLKKTGENKFAGFNYFELADLLPKITELENKYKYITLISFTSSFAEAKVVNIENPEEVIFFQSPMSTANLGGCMPVQNLGAVETYIRRYLYNCIYEIVECDVLDATAGKEEEKKTSTVAPKTSATTSKSTLSTKQINYLKYLGASTEEVEQIKQMDYNEAQKKIDEFKNAKAKADFAQAKS